MNKIKILAFSAMVLFGMVDLPAYDHLGQETQMTKQICNNVVIYKSPSIDSDIKCSGLYAVDILFLSLSDSDIQPKIVQRLIPGSDRVSKHFNIDRTDLIEVFVQQLLPSDTTAFDEGENGTFIVSVNGVLYPIALDFYESGIASGIFTIPK